MFIRKHNTRFMRQKLSNLLILKNKKDKSDFEIISLKLKKLNGILCTRREIMLANAFTSNHLLGFRLNIWTYNTSKFIKLFIKINR